MGNAIKYIKKEISNIPNQYKEEEVRNIIKEWLGHAMSIYKYESILYVNLCMIFIYLFIGNLVCLLDVYT